MNQNINVRERLRQWIINKNEKIHAKDLTNETPIIEQRIISSLHIIELLLLIEELSEKPISVSQIKEDSFRNLNTIYNTFFEEINHENSNQS